jgi:hypothetical protein
MFFKPDTSSLLSKHLTADIWNEYKGVDGFRQCIFSGVSNQESSVGVYAGASSHYTDFKKLFDPIVNEYHSHRADVKHVSDMKADVVKSDFTP